MIDPHRDRIAADRALVQDLDRRAFNKAEFDQPLLQLDRVERRGGSRGFERRDHAGKTARRIAEPNVAGGVLIGRHIRSHGPYVAAVPLPVKRRAAACDRRRLECL